ncbi:MULTISPECIES: thioesterase family protein [Corynebacterium]|uniref:Acyl-CoA thioesterase n=2 Tax=Corynebacterium TaxID=1716 RepID=A0A558INQ8_9CORY|nr:MULTISPECIES: thioesterase family protein [Corynebacterium]MTD90787.1 acyl-CoA thioesterase [Corynebacterium aurimucosum]OFK65896.1 thioesterase [Corynebacterium sp. HMSC076G08]OFO97720.1 thioesterase [Corynebacterium sp. HMSC034H07]TRX60997.1 acyl-CoA thioesterase [Corynebacterium aurimucosum]TVU82990.1 acyl-CoA thioesterase [Corynebacterium aurimucosum]
MSAQKVVSEKTTDNVHALTVGVRWSDFDMYGHMMNSNFIELAQEARLAFAMHNFYARGVNMVAFVRHIDADYVRPIKWDGQHGTVTVETTVVRLGTTSFTTRQKIKDAQGQVACVIDCVQVAIDPGTQMPREVTEEERNIILEHAVVELDEQRDHGE